MIVEDDETNSEPPLPVVVERSKLALVLIKLPAEPLTSTDEPIKAILPALPVPELVAPAVLIPLLITDGVNCPTCRAPNPNNVTLAPDAVVLELLIVFATVILPVEETATELVPLPISCPLITMLPLTVSGAKKDFVGVTKVKLFMVTPADKAMPGANLVPGAAMFSKKGDVAPAPVLKTIL